jgi:hypothetical protein
MLLPRLALVAAFSLIANLAEAAGIQFIEVPVGSEGRALIGAVWYPCAEPDQRGRSARNASEVFKIFGPRPKKTFATVSAKSRHGGAGGGMSAFMRRPFIIALVFI